MKYLFLDIDGVLNHEKWYRDKVHAYKETFQYWWESCFDPECIKRLNKILDQTGARLVVSSSWRSDPKLKTYFDRFNITTDFDVTPIVITEDNDRVDRGVEIDEFLKDHLCENYVILDDDMDFTEDQLQNHFVHCCCDYVQAFKEGHEGQTGLTELKMNESINILNK